MSEALGDLAEESGKVLTSDEDILLNAEDDIIETQDETYNEDEWYEELDTSKPQETDILDISDSGKELDAEKSNDSEEGDESPTERGKFITERVANTPTGDVVQIKRKKLGKFPRNHAIQKNFHHGPNKRMHSNFGNRNGMDNGPRLRFNQHNRFNRFPNSNQQRFRQGPGFSQQQPMRPEFRPNMPFNPMQHMMSQVAVLPNNGNYPTNNQQNFQQFPVYPQYVINQTPTTFQTPFIMPNQVQIPQQMPFIQNQPGCNMTQFSGPVSGMMMQPEFSTQQPIRMPLPEQVMPQSDFSVTVTTTTNPNRTENRTVLINPHFKGKVDVQNAQLLWDNQRNQRSDGNNYGRRNLDDTELLRQQEEFINQNRRNLQKRMQRPRYVHRDSTERDYRTPPPRMRYSPTPNYPRRFNNTRNATFIKTADSQKNAIPELKEPEDEETKLYRKRVEDQRRKRELFLKQKEERRRQRMQNEESLVDSTVQDKDTVLSETDPDIITGIGFREENVHNRLNKPVHRTGVLNLKTGLIKPKTDIGIEKNELTSNAEPTNAIKVNTTRTAISKLPNNPGENKSISIKNITQTPSNIRSKQIVKMASGNSTSNTINSSKSTIAVEIDKELNMEDIQVANVSSAPEQDTREKSIEPKAGFLGRRMVIASNASKHNIVVQADASESSNVHPVNRSSGIFSNVVVNQEFSDDEEFNFLEETL